MGCVHCMSLYCWLQKILRAKDDAMAQGKNKHQSNNVLFTQRRPIIPCVRHFQLSAIRLICKYYWKKSISDKSKQSFAWKSYTCNPREYTTLSWSVQFANKWYSQLDWLWAISQVLCLGQVVRTHCFCPNRCILSEIYQFF